MKNSIKNSGKAQQIIDGFLAGKSISQLKTEFGFSKAGIIKFLNKNNLFIKEKDISHHEKITVAFQAGKKPKELSEEYNIGLRYIYKILNKKGAMNSSRKRLIDKNGDGEKIISAYMNFKSVAKIIEEFKYDEGTIYEFLRKNGCDIRQGGDAHIYDLPFSDLSQFQKEVLDGLILGDMTIAKQYKTSHIEIASIKKEFINHIKEIFPCFYWREYTKEAHVLEICGHEAKCKKAYILHSRTDLCLNEFRDRWYPNGIKIVPKDLKFTPPMIKYWYYTDGSSSWKKDKNYNCNGVCLRFCTNCFTKDDCLFLIEELNKLKMEFYTTIANGKDDRYMIQASKSLTIKKILDFMGEYLDCFSYKWKYPKVIIE